MNKIVQSLLLPMAEEVEAFGKQVDALETTVSEAKKALVFTVVGRLYRIEFVLVTKGNVLCPPATLFLRVFPLKTRPMSLHLNELMETTDLRCTYFPYIESPQRLRACFAALCDVLMAYLPEIEAIALDGARYNELWEDKKQILLSFASIKPESVPTEPAKQDGFWLEWNEFYERFGQVGVFTTDRAYIAFMRGDIKAARRLYQKRAEKDKLQMNEVRIYAFLQTSAAADYRPMPDDCLPIFEGNELNNGAKEGKQIFLTAAVLYVLLAAVFAALTVGCRHVVGQGVVLMPMEDWLFSVLLLPALPALFGGMALRRWVLKHFGNKDKERLQAVDEMVNSNGVYRFAQGLTVLLLAASLWLAVVFSLSTPRFYADRMVYDDAENFPFLHSETYDYADLEKVYFIEGRYNDFDDYIARGSYVLRFADGRVIDLDGTLSEKASREQMLPLLQPYVDGVTTVHSDRDLAKLYGTTADELFGW